MTRSGKIVRKHMRVMFGWKVGAFAAPLGRIGSALERARRGFETDTAFMALLLLQGQAESILHLEAGRG